MEESCALLQPSSRVIARVGGDPIRPTDLVGLERRLEELEERHLRDEVAFVRARDRAQEDALAAVIEQRVLAQEAAARGANVAQILSAESQKYARSVTGEQLDLFYRANAARLVRAGPQTDQDVRRYLEARNSENARSQAVANLERQHEVREFREPLRVPVTGGCAPPKGSNNPTVTIVEFGDFECPYCAAMEVALRSILQQFPHDVQLYFRNSAVNRSHTHAQSAAEASLCAAEQGKFWLMHDAFFREPRKLGDADIRAAAIALHMDASSFDACVATHRYAGVVAHDAREGTILGVPGTPTIFVNGVQYAGIKSYPELWQIVEHERKLQAVRRPDRRAGY